MLFASQGYQGDTYASRCHYRRLMRDTVAGHPFPMHAESAQMAVLNLCQARADSMAVACGLAINLSPIRITTIPIASPGNARGP
jgi:hypothetical protein